MSFQNIRADVPVYKDAADLPTVASSGQAASTEDGLFFVYNGFSWIEKASGGGGTWGSIAGTLSDQVDLQNALDAKQDSLVGVNGSIFYQVAANDIQPIPGLSVDSTYGGITSVLDRELDNNTLTANINSLAINVKPLQDSPDEATTLSTIRAELDPDNSGYDMGTDGRAVTMQNYNISNEGTGSSGEFVFTENYFNVGNGTDPIDIRGVSYSYGFGNINANVTVNGPLQGYGFQPTADSASTFTSAAYILAFYDTSDLDGVDLAASYTSFTSAPTIGSLPNNNGFTGYNLAPQIDDFLGNSSFTGVNIAPVLGTFGTGGFNAINISPTIADVDNGYGIYINMTNALGTNIKAMEVVGDVSITGDLSFTGALSIGQLNAFYGTNPVDGGGNPTSLHGLITGMTALDGVTVANGDAIGVNTSMLITLEDNSVTTSGAFELGFTALALPCVVETHTGATLDFMSGVTAAINLVGTSTGGTIDELRIFRSIPVPNGITTVNKSYGYFYHEPFGGVATDSWGIYILDAQKNYIENPLKVGGSDAPDSGFHLHVEGDSKLEGDLAHLSGNVGFYGKTPVAQPASSGVATAGGTYTATEQTMLQEVYNAVRALGLMS